MRECGAPNGIFPFVAALRVAIPKWNSLHAWLQSWKITASSASATVRFKLAIQKQVGCTPSSILSTAD
jgi:hypothetical protein